MIPTLFLLLFLCFSLPNHGLNAAQATSDLAIMLNLDGRAPIVVEKSPFDSLMDNEVKRAANVVAISTMLKQDKISILELKNKLAHDAKRIDKSAILFDRFKKQAGCESPKSGKEYARVKVLFDRLDNVRFALLLEERELERIVQFRRNRNLQLPGDNVKVLLRRMQSERLKVPGAFRLSATLTEQDIAPYHMSAFSHMLLLDAEYNEAQTAILKYF